MLDEVACTESTEECGKHLCKCGLEQFAFSKCLKTGSESNNTDSKDDSCND